MEITHVKPMILEHKSEMYKWYIGHQFVVIKDWMIIWNEI
jgi:hypothetical protein